MCAGMPRAMAGANAEAERREWFPQRVPFSLVHLPRTAQLLCVGGVLALATLIH